MNLFDREFENNFSSLDIWVFIAHLVEHDSVNAEAMGPNPIEKNFQAKICDCLNCNYNDHISILSVFPQLK